MDFQNVIIRFFKSPLGLATTGLILLGASLAILVGHFSPLAVVPVALVVLVTALVLILQTRAGARAVVEEQDRERQEREARILGGVAAARKRLSLLRVPAGPVKEAIDRLVYAAGLYLEATLKGRDRDPIAEDAILSALEVVDEYLHRLDAVKTAGMLGGIKDSPMEGPTGQAAGLQDEPDLTAYTAQVLQRSVDELQRRLQAYIDEGQHFESGDLLS